MHLYVHIPFCHHICPYCGFYKHTPSRLANQDFVEAVLSEAEKRLPDVSGKIETAYFGGGTPTLLSCSHLTRLCEGLTGIFDFSDCREWTIEANPATFDLKKAKLMRELGLSRVSLGIQSFTPETLKTLDRDHTREDAIKAFKTLRTANFDQVSLDLMFSIPGQTLEQWQDDLETAVSLSPNHISAYNLTYEEDTEFLKRHETGELDIDEDRDADQFYLGLDYLEENGYHHYEISNYARPDGESQHNRAYWFGADYLGLGPGAVTTLNRQRWKTLPDTAAYIKASAAGLDTRTNIEVLTDEDKRLEALALQLRTREGVPLSLIETPGPVKTLARQGLLVEEGGRLLLTRHGKALADPIAAALA